MMNFFSKLQIRIMDYVTYICQMKKLKSVVLSLLLFASSCAQYTRPLMKVDAKANWFNVPKRFSFRELDRSLVVHPFFDLLPFPHGEDNSVNAVITTELGSLYGRELDLYSGKLYKKHNYCDQEDVWKKYSGDIKRPNYSIGFVPRLLDQLGAPQKVIIFGKKRYFPKSKMMATHSQRVRVVGGFVKQLCKNYPCQARENWLSKLVLVAVNANDPEFSNVFRLEELKHKVKWDYVKAFVENGDGRTIGQSFDLPAYRMVGNIGAKESLAFAVKKGHLFKYKSLNKMRRSCHKLYDHIWNSVKELRHQKSEADKLYTIKKKKLNVSSKEDKENVKLPSFLLRTNVLQGDSVRKSEAPLKKNIRNKSFAHFMKNFSERYKDRFKTCQKFVRASSINENVERHWFFVLFSGYFAMESLNFVYHCPSRAWIENPRLSGGKFKYDPVREIHRCSTEDLDAAFDSAVTVLTGRRRSNLEHYTYVQYDDNQGGSHQKLYSWIYDSGKRLSCGVKKEDDNDEIFPHDVYWQAFGSKTKGRNDYIR